MAGHGYDAFATGFGDWPEMSSVPEGSTAQMPEGAAPGFDEPGLSSARSRLYVREQDKRPTSTGQTAPAPVPAASQSSTNFSRAAGVSVLVAAVGIGVGAFFGRWWGAGAGLLAAGALRNAARARSLWGSADAMEREEASSSATVALLGGAGAGYLAYRAYRYERLE